MTVLYKASDRCTDLILDFIAGGWTSPTDNKVHAMESGGNYNAVIGNPHANDPLARYALAEIRVSQTRMLQIGKPSSAIGRYQIVRATLDALCDQGRADRSQRFTPELQDRFGWMLLCRRGYSEWWTHHSLASDRDFAHRLSLEWASLPDPLNGGRSHYDGVGPNHAGCSLADVLDMLRRARALQ